MTSESNEQTVPDRNGTEFVVTDLLYNGSKFRVAALFADGKAQELKVERLGERSRVGFIYRGTVDNVVQNFGGAFIRVGKETMFLPIKRNAQKSEWPSASSPVLVQVVKDAAGRKEPVVTRDLQIGGRYAVLFQKKGMVSYSQKLSDEQKELLTKWLRDTDLEGRHVILRTNAAWAQKAELLAEIAELKRKMQQIEAGVRVPSGPEMPSSCLYSPEPFYLTMWRDLYETPLRCATDIPAAAEVLRPYTEGESELILVERAGSGLALPEQYQFGHILDKLTQKIVWLRSGAFLVIEKTEAFISIDVNTGRCAKGRKPEETFRSVNLEAAEEIVRQLMLRNLSGMILVDFISMERKEHNEELINVMKKNVRRDHVRTEVIDITPLGIMEIVRARHEKPLAEVLGLC